MNLTQNPTLEGLRDNLLTPIEIIRDEDGYFYHPALPLTDENVSLKKFLGAFGIETDFVSMEDDCTDEALLESVSDGGCAAWKPSPPTGDGWMLLAIYDTEEGIVAMFAREAPTTILPRRHRDDAAVDRFATAMKAKMASARAKGRSGWDDPSQCTAADLSRMLREHVAKGDPVDVANFAMMLHQRSSAIVSQPLEAQPPFAMPPMNEDLLAILGMICFQCIRPVQAMRLGGHAIQKKAEHEQAHVIHFLLEQYFKHGKDWMTESNKAFSAMAESGKAEVVKS